MVVVRARSRDKEVGGDNAKEPGASAGLSFPLELLPVRSGGSAPLTSDPVTSASKGVLDERAGNRSFHLHKGPRESWSFWRRNLAILFETKTFEIALGVVIFSNIIVMCVEVDRNAECDEYCAGDVLYFLNIGYITLYTIESCLRIVAYRGEAFRDRWTVMDLFIVIMGWAELILSLAPILGLEELEVKVNFLRIFRVLRLVRATKVLRIFPELHTMVVGFASAMAAMFWGFIMILGMLLFWSVFAVEFVHPVNKAHFHDDEWCQEAFQSVSRSILMFFQTLVAGDSWGLCAIPLIREYPALFGLFSMSLVSVQLGFTNLILSTIVDSASKAREEDREMRLESVRLQRQEATNVLLDLLVKIDTDESGAVSFEELEDGYNGNENFQQILHQLGLGPEDLRMLFDVMDPERTGAVSYNEFIEYIHNVSGEQLQNHLLLARLFSRRDEVVESLLNRIGVHPPAASRSTRSTAVYKRVPSGPSQSCLSSKKGDPEGGASKQFSPTPSLDGSDHQPAHYGSAQQPHYGSSISAPRKEPGTSVPMERTPLQGGYLATESTEVLDFTHDRADVLQELDRFAHQMAVKHTQMALGLGQIVTEFHTCTQRLQSSLGIPPAARLSAAPMSAKEAHHHRCATPLFPGKAGEETPSQSTNPWRRSRALVREDPGAKDGQRSASSGAARLRGTLSPEDARVGASSGGFSSGLVARHKSAIRAVSLSLNPSRHTYRSSTSHTSHRGRPSQEHGSALQSV